MSRFRYQSLSGISLVYLVKEGRVRFLHMLEDGQEVTTAVLRPGQLFGLCALFGGDESATNAVAVEPSLICEAGGQDFLAMLARHPLLMAKVVMVTARQIFQLEHAIETIASQTVPSRLAAPAGASWSSAPISCGRSPSRTHEAERGCRGRLLKDA